MKKCTAISGSPSSPSFLISILFLFLSLPTNADDGWWETDSPVVKRANERIPLLKTEYGEISTVDFADGSRFGHYHLQFITLEPNSLFLPVLLHADMVFYTHTGSGRLSWFDDDDLREVDIRRGDIYRLHPGSIFYLQSNLETEREKLRIYALFSSTDEDSFNPSIGAYSRVTDLVRGFDKEVLRKAFMAPEEVIEEIMNAKRPPLIVHAATTPSKKKKKVAAVAWELEARLLKTFIGGASGMEFNKKKKKGVYNVYEVDPDFENCNGWSLTVTKKNSHQLKGSNIGFLVVNLTSGSMMGPHWNPWAWEIGIVTSDEPGVVRVGCSSTKNSSKCKNWSFVVGKGDVFVVPRFHPMAQMSFNNGTFVFVGFSTTNGHNMPQFLAGSSSVLQIVDREVLAWSFDVNVTTVDRLLGARVESIILECTSCAEEEVRKMEEEAEREREEEEEERKREEEEERKREEEERKREEEEERKREEEERKREEEEEERKREEEEERKREEEEERKREEEREQEEERRREEEEAKREEERRRREEEERREEKEEERGEREAKREEEEAREREETHQRERGRRRRETEREAEERQRRRWEEEKEEEEEEEQPRLRILGVRA
ncbi:vicilin-like seed storage protein At2g18540 [Benincasa hispida]|uniref:vicilin-like seed storage protein At2g18540 n=1 Tax=Benincasa hispida TaxID=102211 RepID=UPI0018FFFBC2|nr:vicilin-like seed storage protein At2g18540 [Benincasa hispida]